MRNFSFITVVQIVNEVREEGVRGFSRSTFYRWVDKFKWPLPPRNASGWRNFGPKDPLDRANPESAPYSAPYYKALIKKSAGMRVEVPPRPEGLLDYDEAKQQDEEKQFQKQD